MTLNILKRTTKFKLAKYLFCLYVLLPIIALYTFLRFYPILQTFILGFHKWDLLMPVKPWIGFDNYYKLLSSPQFFEAVRNTTVFTVLFVPLTIIFALMLALLINYPGIGKFISIYQFIYFIPVVCSMVPSAVVWRWIYDPQFGLLNYFISLFRVPPKAWLLEENLALPSIVIFSVWKQVGYYMIIFFVGLKAIPKNYYEAAKIDGANNWQLFRNITLPQLKPITLLILVMSTIGAFQVFTQVMVLTTTETDMGRTVRVFVFDIYENAFRFYKMGYASAEAVVLFIIVASIAILQFRFFRER